MQDQEIEIKYLEELVLAAQIENLMLVARKEETEDRI